MQFPRPEVVVARRSVGFSCPETSTDTAYLVRGDTLTPLVEVSATGEAGYHDGSSLFWGGDAGTPTHLVGFPRLELAKGVEASRHVTVIHEVVEGDQFICSTRRRYRFDGAKLVLLGSSYRMTAAEALAEGLVHEVHEPDALLPRCRELASIIARQSPTALRRSLRVLRRHARAQIREELDPAWDAAYAHFWHPDGTEGPLAFLEKRDPVWAEPA